MIGEQLSHFKIEEKVGQGGMGVVYKGRDIDLDRPVAIKILHPEAQKNETSIARFLREAKTASKLTHPAITTIYEFGVKEDMRYLVMEYVEGKTVCDLLENGPLSIPKAVDIAIQVTDALALAGEHGIVHRDIKSENIMVTDRGHVKILDFGLAKMVESEGGVSKESFHTAAGLLMGTVSYMSPEQALGSELDPRSDIYSLGVVLFETVTGKLPFKGSSPSVVIAKILNKPPPKPSDINPDCPQQLENIIIKCLEKNRDVRYQNAQSLLKDLSSLKLELKNAMIHGHKLGAETAAKQESKDEETIAFRSSVAHKRTDEIKAPSEGQLSSRWYHSAGDPMRQSGKGQSSSAAQSEKEGSDSSLQKKKIWLTTVKSLKIGLHFFLLIYAIMCALLFLMPLIPIDHVWMVYVYRAVHFMALPLLTFVCSLTNLPETYNGLYWVALLIAFAVMGIRQFANSRLEKTVQRLDLPFKKNEQSVSGAIRRSIMTGSRMTRGSSHMTMGPTMSRRLMDEAWKEMAFLSIDMATTEKMRSAGLSGSDAEQAIIEYRKFVERTFREFHVYKIAVKQDEMIGCFLSADAAATAGRHLIMELDWFNNDILRTGQAIKLRMGVSWGEVMLPDAQPLEEVTSHVIELASFLRKQAGENSLWASGEAYSRLMDRTGFVRLAEMLNNSEVFAFTKE